MKLKASLLRRGPEMSSDLMNIAPSLKPRRSRSRRRVFEEAFYLITSIKRKLS
jgi:hypothetical protein